MAGFQSSRSRSKLLLLAAWCVALGAPPALSAPSTDVSDDRRTTIRRAEARGEFGAASNVTCAVSPPDVNLRWEFAGRPLELNSSKYEVDAKVVKDENVVTLTVLDARLPDHGNYTCLVEGEADLRKDVFLNLTFPTTIISGDDPVRVKNGETAALSCVFRGFNLTEVKWRKYPNLFKPLKLPEYDVHSTIINDTFINGTINFPITNKKDNGTYMCAVWKSKDVKTVASRDLLILERPQIKFDFVKAIGSTKVYLNWTVVDGNSPINKYDLRYKEYDKDQYMFTSTKIDISSHSFVLTGLTPNTTYTLKISANNSLGSATDDWPSITTLDDDPHFVPTIMVKGPSSSSVTIGWNPVPENLVEYVHYYELTAKEKDSDTSEAKAFHSGNSKNPYMFENLNPYTTYIFQVRACSDWTKECGNWSLPVNGSTLDGPSGPVSVESFSCEVDEISGINYINVTWKLPVKPNGQINYYDLELTGNASYINGQSKIEATTYGPKSKHTRSDVLTARFDSLPANTNFTLKLSAVTRIKRTGQPVYKYCSTPPSVPPRDAMRDIRWIRVRESHGRWMFKLYMPRVTERNGAICCYRIFIVRMKNQQKLSDMPSPEHLTISSYNEVHNGKSGAGAYIAEIFTSDNLESDIILGDGTTIGAYSSQLMNQCQKCASVLPYKVTTTTTQIPNMIPYSTVETIDNVNDLEDNSFHRVVSDNSEPEEEKIPITLAPENVLNDIRKPPDASSVEDLKMAPKKKRRSEKLTTPQLLDPKNIQEFQNIQEISGIPGDLGSTVVEERVFKLDKDFYVDQRISHQNRKNPYINEESSDSLNSKDDFENELNYLGGHKIVSRQAGDFREGKKIEPPLQGENRAEDELLARFKNADTLKNSEHKPTETLTSNKPISSEDIPKIFDGQLDKDSNYTGFVELIVHSEHSSKMLPMYSDYFTVLKPGPNVINKMDNQLEFITKVVAVCAVVAFIILICICFYYERSKRKTRQQGVEMHTLQNTLRNLYHGLKGGRHQLVPHNPPDMPPILKENLLASYNERQLDSGYGFQHEFELLPDCFSDRTMDASEAKENQSKNRYPDIKAYDQTRVKLSNIDSIVGSDYINANIVIGYKERKKFICAQGPTDVTVNDFWRMIWEYNLELVVMLTNLEEYSKVKCSKYWPDQHQQDKLFHNINVQHISEKRYSDYIIRELRITKQNITNSNSNNQIIEANGIKKNGLSECNNGHGNTSTTNEERIVHQYHFLMWKDFVAPEYPYAILKFIKRMNEASSAGRPILVHCSAGVGRTGTLVALDCLLQQLSEEGETAIFNTICDLRRQRNFLVQSLKQYVFVYRTLVEYSHYDDTEISAARLKTTIDRLRQTAENSDICAMEEQFEKIKQPVLEIIKPCTSGKAVENMAKNRSESVVPYDHNRVILPPIPTKENSTYINASFIEGYDNSESYIITQDPLATTIGDFWRMVSEHEISTIVMLSELGDGKCPRYWDDDEIQYDHINVTYLLSESCPYYTRREFQVTNTKNQDRIRVTQLQYHGWPTVSGQVPEVTRGLIELLGQCNVSSPKSGPPLLVHCSLGTDRSSMFVALSILTIQLRTEKRIDVSTVTRKLRSQRMCCLDTFLQYEFLHRAIVNYAELHNLLSDS